MAADSDQDARLRELHDAYAWKVNAAVAEGRDDLIRQLSDEYVEEALRIMTEGSPEAGTACGEDCAACARPRPAPPAGHRRRRWFGLFTRDG